MKRLLSILMLGMFLMSTVAYAAEHGGKPMKVKKAKAKKTAMAKTATAAPATAPAPAK